MFNDLMIKTLTHEIKHLSTSFLQRALWLGTGLTWLKPGAPLITKLKTNNWMDSITFRRQNFWNSANVSQSHLDEKHIFLEVSSSHQWPDVKQDSMHILDGELAHLWGESLLTFVEILFSIMFGCKYSWITNFWSKHNPRVLWHTVFVSSRLLACHISIWAVVILSFPVF